jgi:pyrimidine-nucleoside phosphorylase
VRAGEPIASVFARDAAGIALGMAALGEAVVIGEEGRRRSLVSHRITAKGVELLAEER